MVAPSSVVFNRIADEVETARLTEGQLLQQEAEKRQAALDAKEGVNVPMVESFFNRIMGSSDTTQEERREVEKLFRLAGDKIDSTHAETTTILAPVIIYGGMNLFFAIFCVRELLHTIKIEESTTHVHLIWFIINALSYVMATVGRGHGMQTGGLIMLMIGLNVGFIVCWLYVYRKIMIVLINEDTKEDGG
jgi:hypothetical protein